MRKAIISEAQDLYILRAQSFQHFCKLAYSPEELETIIHAYTPTEIALAVSSGNIFVLEESGVFSGYVWIEAGFGKELAVNPEFIGRGVGKKLLIEGLRIITSKSSSDIEIFATLNTVRFYQRYGFVPQQRVKLKHQLTGKLIALHKMSLGFSKARELVSRNTIKWVMT